MWKAAVVGTKAPFGRIKTLLQLKDRLEVVAVCDLQEAAVRQCAAELNIPHVYTDYNRMLEELEFDILVSYTGTYARKGQVIAAAAAGKHIFTEKPLALSIADGQEMRDAVRQSGVKFQIGYQLRTFYFARAMKALVDNGTLGQIDNCMSRRFMPVEYPTGPDGSPSWYAVQEKSGGITVDYLTHDIDLMRFCLGDVKRVSAATRRSRQPTGDSNAWAILEFASGAMGMIGSSFSATFPSCDIMLIGTEGSCRVEAYKELFVKLWHGEEKPAAEYCAEPQDPADVSVVQYERFLDCLDSDRNDPNNVTPSPGIDDAYAAIEVALAMQQSSRTGAAVELPL